MRRRAPSGEGSVGPTAGWTLRFSVLTGSQQRGLPAAASRPVRGGAPFLESGHPPATFPLGSTGRWRASAAQVGVLVLGRSLTWCSPARGRGGGRARVRVSVRVRAHLQDREPGRSDPRAERRTASDDAPEGETRVPPAVGSQAAPAWGHLCPQRAEPPAWSHIQKHTCC